MMATAARELVITNGDVAGELLRHTLQGAEVLPWRDVLHEGPVPLTETLDELTAIRASYLASCFWGDLDELQASLEARNRGLAFAAVFSRVTLWFEHDPYDQLQLLQILNWFEGNAAGSGTLFVVQTGAFLGKQTQDALFALKRGERPVTAEQLALASAAWDAYRSPTPQAWFGLLDRDVASRQLCSPPCRAAKRLRSWAIGAFGDCSTGLRAPRRR
jgi:hypothetical protein